MNGPIAPSLEHQQKQDRNRDIRINSLTWAVIVLGVFTIALIVQSLIFRQQFKELATTIEQLVQ